MEYGSFFKRFLAGMIDSLILTFVYLVLLPFPIINNLIWGLFVIYYHVIFETSVMRGTPGKYYMQITIVDKLGDNISTRQSLVRYFASYLSTLVFFFGYFLYFFTQRKQTLHDLLAETYVTRGIIVDVSVWDTFIEQSKLFFNNLKNNLR